VLVRSLEPDDAWALAAFYEDLDEYTDFMYFVLSEFTPAVVAQMAELQRSRRELHVVLEEDDGRVVGHLSLQPYPGVCPRLGVCVIQDWQSRGLGRQLMDLAVDLVRSFPKATGIWLSVLEQNDRAIALYESLGFQRLGDRVVDRAYSRFPGNTGAFTLVNMLLSFGDG
jgi:putative acetyltransferase